MKLLERILIDKTTQANIIWATDAYSSHGDDYRREMPIKPELITLNDFTLMSRADKALSEQAERTKAHAEVFTPLWVVKKMNDYVESDWFGYEGAFEADRVIFPEGKTWQKYVDSKRLEITCGEAPYLVSRYDVSTGDPIPLEARVGILDRKLRVVDENTTTEEEWLKWAYRAFQATYGYEFQGDNVLVARINLLLTFEEYLAARWQRKPTTREYRKVINIIVWNIWQMDGLTDTIPYCRGKDDLEQFSFFSPNYSDELEIKKQPPCRIFDWRARRPLVFKSMKGD